ncbi:MAG: glycosyltransferase [Mogibacterium sp.]|nr:glycosyltransferase [Mogibacterium sp.]
MITDISVIMPMYNVEEEYLRASIGSLLAQTKKDGIELIITDDGSSNGCGAVADEYALRHKNIQVIHTENQGAGPARNTAIKRAKGKYLAFLDADDLMVPDALEKMFDRAEYDQSEVAMINAIRFDSNKESQASIHKIAFRNLKEVTSVSESPQLIYDTVSWDKLIRRDFWEKNKLEYPPTSL